MRFAVCAALAAIVATASPALAQRSFDPQATYPVATAGAPERGPASAPVTIVEFSDFSCQFCLRAQTILAQLQHLFPGKLRLVYRQLPLDIEDGSLAAEASLAAADQGQFWPMHDRLFASPGPFTREVIEGYARELGLDLARFRDFLDQRTGMDAIRRDYQAAVDLGFSSTPMFFINGRPVRGAQPLSVFAEVVSEEIDRADTVIRGGVERDQVYEHLVGKAEVPAAAGAGADTWEPAELDPMAVYAVGLGLPGHQLGPDDALVTIVEFTDFECGFCAKSFPVVKRLLEAYPDAVRVVFRHLPLRFHPHAQLASEAAVEAAEQGALEPYAALLFGNQRALERADLERYAEAVGLDMDRFRAALDDRRHHDAVVADAAAANALGITGTPTLFVNGQPVIGAVPYEQLDAIVRTRMEQARMVLGAGVERGDIYTMITVAAEKQELGDRSRVPAGTAAGGAVELEALDAHTAVLAACQARDPDRAARFYDRLTGALRVGARTDCRVYGVDLE